MVKSNRKKLFVCMALSSVMAQAADYQLEEVVVTAQKREQSTKDVPVSLSAFSAEALRSSGIDSVEDLESVAPGIGFDSSLSSAGEGVRARGVGSSGFNSGVEQSVSVIIDNVVTGPSGSGLSQLWDVERVEILRGPQGTLFGKNASAGAVNVVSNRPTDTFEAELSANYEFEYETTKVEGVISGPLTDNLRGRLSGFSLNQDKGLVDNINTGKTTNKKEQWGLRGSLDYDSDSWSTKLTIAYDKASHECCARTFRSVDLNAASPLTLGYLLPALARTGLTLSETNRQIIAEEDFYEHAETLHTAFEVSKSLSTGQTIKSITGYRHWDQSEANDPDTLDIDLISFSRQARDLKVYTQEFQLLSPTDQDWEYVAGLYFYHQQFDENTELFGGTDFPAPGFGQLGRTFVDSEVEVDNYAVFGQVGYNFSERLKVYAGARILHEEISAEGVRYEDPDPAIGPHFAFPGAPFFPVEGGSRSASDDNAVGTLGVQYYTEAENMLYAKVTRGYKGQAIDLSVGSDLFKDDPDNIAVLDPETVVSFEVGSKNFFFDHTLSVDLSVYYSKFKGFQASAFDGNRIGFVLSNAGDLQTKGFELDVASTPWEGGLVNFYLTYTNAETTKFEGAPCTVLGTAQGTCVGFQDLSGKDMPATPLWKYTLSMQQDFELGNDMQMYIRGQYTWRDEVISSGDLDPNTKIDAYGLANFRLGFIPNDQWEITAYVDNAFDEDYPLRVFDAPLFEGAYSQYQGKLRTYGVEVRTFF